MKKAKKLLSLFLAVLMLYSGMSVGMYGINVLAASVSIDNAHKAVIAVPETVYMTPSTGASTTGQYYVNNKVSSGNYNVELEVSNANTNGYVQMYIPGAKSVKYAVNTITSGIGDINASGEGTSYTLDGNGYLALNTTTISINGTGVSAGNTALAEWVFTVTMNDGSVRTYYAYSTLYSPYYYPIGVATRAKAYKGTSKSLFAQSIAWVSGVHGFTANTSGKHWIALTNETFDDDSDNSGNGTYYAKTSGHAMVPLIYGVGTASNTTSGVTDWIQSSSPGGGITVPTIRYCTWEYGGTSYRSVMINDVSPVANITIDTSRYTNLNQIPNLTVGYNVTDTENCDGAYWYASDFTDVAHKYTTAFNETNNFKNWTKRTTKSGILDYAGRWFDSTSTGSIYKGSASGTTAYNSGVEYNSAYDRAIVTSSDYYDYIFKGALHTYENHRAYSINFVQLRGTNTNKSALRKLVIDGAALNANNYTSATWNEYQTALRNAALALGNPANATVDTSTLTSKMNALQTKVKLNANGGSINGASEATVGITVGAASSATYNLSSYVPTRDGYTFKGWATSRTATSGSTSVSAGLTPTFYAIWEAASFTILFDNIFDYSKFTIGTGSLSIDEKTDTGFTVTSTSGADANTGFSYAIPVEPGKTYVFSADVSIEQASGDSSGFDMYIHTLNSSQAGETTATPDTSNGAHREGNVYISLTGQKTNGYKYIRFTTGETTRYIKVRFDANTQGNKLTVNNIRVYEEGAVSSAVSYHAPKEVTYDSTYGELPTPTRPGYTFAGWYDADGNGYWAGDKVIITNDTSLYSRWTANNYVVTFEKNYGDYGSTQQEFTAEESITLPTLTRTGYKHTGWVVKDAASGNWSGTYTPGQVVKGMYGSGILTATWEKVSYTITYDANGGNAVTSGSYDIESGATLAVTERTGYIFGGWEVVENGGNWNAESYSATTYTGMYGNVTLKAKWTPRQYKITFVDWDGTKLKEYDADYDSTPVAPADPTRPDDDYYTYTFAGWEPTIDKVTGEAIYTADYTPTLRNYTITLDANGGEVSQNTITYNGDTKSVTLPTPTKTGYAFGGWEVKTAVGNWSVGAFSGTLNKPYGNVTLVAKWTANNYKLSFDLNDADRIGDATLSDTAVYSFAYNSAITALPEASLVGYTFDGWYVGDTKLNVGDTWTYAEDVTAKAKWTPDTYELSFVTYDVVNRKFNFITPPANLEYNIETDLSAALVIPEVEGYTFGYFEVIDGNGNWGSMEAFETMPTSGKYGNVEVYMYYNLNKYDVVFKNDDGSVLQEGKVYHGNMPSYTGAEPTKAPTAQESFVFAGWTPEISVATENVTYTATFTSKPREYTVTFLDADGSVIPTKNNYKYGDTIEVPADPTKAQDAQFTYTFSGWKDAQGNGVSTTVTDDVVYTADYTAVPRTYTITWIVDGETTTTTVTYGSVPSFDGTPTKDADAQYTYSFLGWSTSENGTVADPESVTGAATYYAVFGATTNKYDVIWQNDDGTELEKDEDVEYGATPSYDGETPTKAADAQYTYTFAGWTPEIDTVTGDVTYKAKYNKTVNEYTVTFVDEDGTVLEKDEGVPYGTTPSYDGTTPTKAATAEWTYAFAGWIVNDNYDPNNGPLPDVTGDVTYKASYTGSKNSYTITFVDEDGTTVLDTQTVAYGEKPELPAEPIKTGDAQYSYTFAAWSPEVVSVTGDATYKATYTQSVNEYTITFYDEDGATILDTQKLLYGSALEYKGKTPTKASTADKIYAFSGWATSIDGEVIALQPVTGDAEYYAIYISTDTKFTVTWIEENGNKNIIDEVQYGTAASTLSRPADQTREKTDKYTYTFVGWNVIENSKTELDLETYKITADTTFYPAFSESINKYTITFVNEDGTFLQSTDVAYDEIPVYTGETPTKAADVQYTYTHSGWTPEVVAVTGAATYTATYSNTVNKYVIKFVNDNGDVLQESEWEYGSTPVYSGATPTKAADAQYTYTFNTWDNEIVSVTGAATYTATYTNTVNKYLITFVNEDGTVLQESEVEYGKTPVYAGETPVKAATAQYTYTFKDWGTISSVTEDATYTATYTATVNKYTIKFVDEDGTTVLDSAEFEYGQTPATDVVPTKTATAQYTYTFAGWSPAIVSVTGEATYTATYSFVVNKYTVEFLNADGTVLQSSEWEYGFTPVYSGETPAKASTASTVFTFAGWDAEIVSVTGDATYTATYSETTRKYTITWIVNGVETKADVEYGTTPEFDGTPVKESTAEFEYEFKGWTPEVTEVVGDATYTAVFTAKIRSYKVTWITGSGEFTGVWEYGSTPDPDVDGVDTSKPDSAEAVYTFSHWDKEIAAVTGNVTYTAVYNEDVKSYMVTYKIDGEVVHEEMIKFGSSFNHPAIPEKEGHSSYWNCSFITVPAHDVVINAVYEAKTYKVTWVADGETVFVDEVKFNEEIPEHVVPVIKGHTGIWEEIPATMPATDIVISAIYVPNVYAVTWNFSYTAGTDVATYGKDYAVTFNAAYLPLFVRVTVDGVVVADDMYSYDYTTGEFFLVGIAITGAVSITEKAAEGYQNVVVAVSNATLTNSSSVVEEGHAYHTQIVPAEGYLLPETITVFIDGVELYYGYTYDANTGRLTVNAEMMLGELTISVDCPEDPNYEPSEGDDCGCSCHGNSFVRFFFKIITALRKLFGMKQYQYCDCGVAHW